MIYSIVDVETWDDCIVIMKLPMMSFIATDASSFEYR
ncbi:hypothetical protein SAMN05428642_101379 [Flaviramulus basaltis]|uniref:Uncharacterized protein n=1 Tax=Flaviramulus basaltis TaxID=369401 RepID=A0A1K2IBC3_9FLAO|nr:hypothetical protein SAMN05428642_101379 [Flaviramulus basaltis]